MTVSSINTSYSIASVARTKIQSKELVFAKAKISINGVSVQIGGSVEETARRINRVKDRTGVEAHVVTSNSGVKTIQLVVKRGNNLRINDQSGVLKGLVGTSDKHLIKVIKANGQGKVSVQYTNAPEHHNKTKELYLRSSRETAESRKRANHPPVPNIDPIINEEVEIEPLGPIDMFPIDPVDPIINEEVEIEPLEAIDMFPIDHVVPQVGGMDGGELRPRLFSMSAPVIDEVELGQDPLSILRDNSDPYRLQEQERLEQERMQIEYEERIAERINNHASGSLSKVISTKNLVKTPQHTIENVERWIGEAIRDSGIRDVVLLAKGEQLKALISKEIIDKRSWFSSAIWDTLDISQKDTKDAVRIAISKLK